MTIPRPDPVPACARCGRPAVGACGVPRCDEHACDCPTWRLYAAAEPAPERCGISVCPVPVATWPRCVLDDGHDGPHAPEAFADACERDAAERAAFQAGVEAERARVIAALTAEAFRRGHAHNEALTTVIRLQGELQDAEAECDRLDDAKGVLCRAIELVKEGK